MIDERIQHCRSLIDEVRQLRTKIQQLNELTRTMRSANTIASYQISDAYKQIEKLRGKITSVLADLGIDPETISDFTTHPENARFSIDRLERHVTTARTTGVVTQTGTPDVIVQPRRRLTRPNISPSQMKRHSESLIN